MAIVPVEKFSLYGSADQKAAVLDGLQELGCMHLLDLGQRQDESISRHHLLPDAAQALKFLRTSPNHRRAVRDDAGFRFDEVVDQALSIEKQQEALQNERDELNQSITELTPWGNFQLPDENEFGGIRFWFYIIPLYRLNSLDETHRTWHVVARDHRFAYVAVLNPEEPDMPVPPVQLDERPLSELQRRLETVETELEDLLWHRVRLTRWTHQLSRTIGLAEDRAARERAAVQTLDEPYLFSLQGWAPQAKRKEITAFADEHCLGMTIEKPTADDSPPTLLSNQGFAAGGEAAVTFYTTPAYRAWDPSGIVFLSFSVFFAMIMADAGYAALLTILVVLCWRRMGTSVSRRRMRSLFVATAVASVAYGILVGSYFGFPPPNGSLVAQLHIIDASDSAVMMRLSIIVGVAHLVIANMAFAWSRRWSPMMLSPIGWSAALVGGLAYGMGSSGIEPEQILTQYGTWGLSAGVILILLFSSELPLFTLSLKNHGKRLLDGILSLTNISRAFGDVLSYLRLFALGLASAQLAATFNEMIYKANSWVGIGSLLAIVAVVFGHGLNFALAIMSGVVHGLRLNCIEFFGWSLPDEGYPFQPFNKRST